MKDKQLLSFSAQDLATMTQYDKCLLLAYKMGVFTSEDGTYVYASTHKKAEDNVIRVAGVFNPFIDYNLILGEALDKGIVLVKQPDGDYLAEYDKDRSIFSVSASGQEALIDVLLML